MLDIQAHSKPGVDDSKRTPAETRGAGTMWELRTRWRELCSSCAPRCNHWASCSSTTSLSGVNRALLF